MVEAKLIPPDGGYGWVIVLACGLYYFITLPIEKGFGLVFKDTFRDLELSAASTSLIINTNSAISMFVGIIVAPLLKYLGYRIVSLIAGSLIVIGVLLTAYANSFSQYIITYGLITALGYGMGVQAYTLVQNVYFIKRRTKAVGYILTICGIGPVIMPQIISLLMESYGVKGAVIIVASIAAHTFVSGLLLQPVKWHMKEEIIEKSSDSEHENFLEKENNIKASSNTNRRSAKSTSSLEEASQVEIIYNIDTPLSESIFRFRESSLPISPRKKDVVSETTIQQNMEKKEYQAISQYEEKLESTKTVVYNFESQDDASSDLSPNKNGLAKENNTKQQSLLKNIGKHLVDIFDLTLLKDPTFVNIVIGMSLAVFSELNFSLLTPFIMHDFGLATQEIATFMSLVSALEIVFRFITPFINDFFEKSVRIMFLWSLVLLILSRFSLLLTSSYSGLLFSGVFLGTCKGFRTVYWSLVIPNNVPIERLAAASGLQYTFNSFLIWTGGPFLGSVKDLTGSYKNCIFVINFVTFLSIVLWTTEFTYKRYKSRRKLDQQSSNIF